MQELIVSGLHRLAQPLTAGLWLIESAEDGADARLNVQRLGSELRRASAVLRFLRAALDVPQAAPLEWVALPAWLRQNKVQWTHCCVPHGVHLEIATPFPLRLRCNRAMLDSAGATLLEQLLQNSPRNASLVVTSAPAALEFRLHLPAPLDEEKVKQAAAALDPFESPKFEFTGDVPPGLVARGLFAACGLGMTVVSSPESLFVRLEVLPQASEVSQ